jgi:hypothetical protein
MLSTITIIKNNLFSYTPLKSKNIHYTISIYNDTFTYNLVFEVIEIYQNRN